MGYYGIFLVLRKQFDRELTKRIDADEYAGSETMIVKVPFALPYQTNFDAYERVDGEFECDGEFYKLVKQKWVADTLFVILIKDDRQTKLHDSLTHFVQTSHDSPLSKSTMKLIDHLEKNFFSSINRLQVCSTGWYQKFAFGIPKQFFNPLYPPILAPPPKFSFIA